MVDFKKNEPHSLKVVACNYRFAFHTKNNYSEQRKNIHYAMGTGIIKRKKIKKKNYTPSVPHEEMDSLSCTTFATNPSGKLGILK